MSGVGAEVPFSDGAATYIVGPSSSLAASRLRSTSWFGAPSIARMVVMPLAM